MEKQTFQHLLDKHVSQEEQTEGYYELTLGFDIKLRSDIFQKVSENHIKRLPRYYERRQKEKHANYQVGKNVIMYLLTMVTARTGRIQYENYINNNKRHAQYYIYILSLFDKEFEEIVTQLFFMAMLYHLALTNPTLAFQQYIPTLFVGKLLDKTILSQLQDSWYNRKKTRGDFFPELDRILINYVLHYIKVIKQPIYWQILFDIFEYYVPNVMNLLNSIIIFPSLSVTGLIVYHAVIDKFIGTDVVLHIDPNEMTKIIHDVLHIVEPLFIFQKSGMQNINKNNDIQTLKYRLYEKDFDKKSKAAYSFKNMYQHLPQNVFVYKLRYFTPISEPHIQFKRYRGVTLYTQDRTKKEKNDFTHPQSILEAPHIQSIQKYTKQVNDLYAYHNRKSFSRKYLFDTISEMIRPSYFSPTVSRSYVFEFEKPKDVHLPFSEAFHKIYHTMSIKLLKRKDHIRYTVKLVMSPFVERYLIYILALIPKECSINAIRRHDMTIIYPMEKKEKETVLIPWEKKIIAFFSS